MADSITLNEPAGTDPTPVPDNVTVEGNRATVGLDDTPQDDRPSWLPEKFKSAEDMAKAYAELEKKQGKGEPPKTLEVTPPAKEGDADPSLWDKAASEFLGDGEVSAETYEALSKQGVAQGVVDSFVAGQKAKADSARTQVAEAVGGTERLQKVLDWAESGISQEEAQAYNAVVQTGNAAAIAMALQGLAARMDAATGTDPNLVKGEGNRGPKGVQPYESREQVVADMRDPRYKSDPAYRQKVMDRLAATDDVFGL